MGKVAEETLCWGCAKACGGGCSWSKDFVPVKGWDAKETRKGYLVTSCPQFEADTGRGRSADSLDTEGCIELMKAAGTAMYHDYLNGVGPYPRDYAHPETLKDTIRKNRTVIEKFITSRSGRAMLMLTDPEAVISALRKRARRFDEHECGEMVKEGSASV